MTAATDETAAARGLQATPAKPPSRGRKTGVAFGDPWGERCLRCGAEMDWRHQTWQCPRCRFKLGCCEGEACDD